MRAMIVVLYAAQDLLLREMNGFVFAQQWARRANADDASVCVCALALHVSALICMAMLLARLSVLARHLKVHRVLTLRTLEVITLWFSMCACVCVCVLVPSSKLTV